MAERWKFIALYETYSDYYTPDGVYTREIKDFALMLFNKTLKESKNPLEYERASISLLLNDGWEPYASTGRHQHCLRKTMEG